MKLVAWLAALSVFSLLPRHLCSQPCSNSDFDETIRSAKAVRAQLLAYKVGERGMDESVPRELQTRIAAYKDALAAVAATDLKCTPVEALAPDVELELSRLLDANKPQTDQAYDPNDTRQEIDKVYGQDLEVRVSRAGKAPGLMLIEFSFGIDCGYDAMLLGYEAQGSEWVRVLRWQSESYDRINAAFGDFFRYLVLPTASGQWRIAVAHGHPWCTSNISAFDLDLIQPSLDDRPQRVLAHEERVYRREEDPVMKIVPGGFQLRMIGESMDPDIVMRPVIFRFALEGDGLSRVQPIADNGRDFVDEWLLSPWADAARWSSAESLQGLKAEHDIVSQRFNGERAPLQTFGPVRACTDSSAHFQVELDAEWLDEKGKAVRDEGTYFQIAERKNSFTMLSASETADGRCTGGDLMPPK